MFPRSPHKLSQHRRASMSVFECCLLAISGPPSKIRKSRRSSSCRRHLRRDGQPTDTRSANSSDQLRPSDPRRHLQSFVRPATERERISRTVSSESREAVSGTVTGTGHDPKATQDYSRRTMTHREYIPFTSYTEGTRASLPVPSQKTSRLHW